MGNVQVLQRQSPTNFHFTVLRVVHNFLVMGPFVYRIVHKSMTSGKLYIDAS